MRELNKVYWLDWLNNGLPDKCAKLIIADPPYYKVKGEFDFKWKTFDDYLADVEKWAVECKRVLADNGTLFWYGDRKNIAYSQVIFDKYFNLESNITVHIYDRQTNKIQPEDARCFINVTERLLMYSNQKCFRDALIGEMIKKGLKEIDFRKLKVSKNGNPTGWCSNIIKGKNDPSKEDWDLICNLIGDYNYNDLKRYFNPTEEYKLDVIRVSQEGHITGEYDHETVKPEKLTRILINTTTRKGDLVVIPFAGSGTECAMAAYEGRPFYGFDITQKYVDMSNDRTAKILKSPQLF